MAATGTMKDAANRVLATLKDAGSAPTKFADSLLELLELTARIQQLDDLNASAQTFSAEETEETRKWKDISMMSANLCRGGLVEQQLKAIEQLQDLAARGGSLCKEAAPAETLALGSSSQKGARAGTGGCSPRGSAESDGDAGTGGVVVRTQPTFAPPPPGLAGPPGLAAPPGLSLPAPKPVCAPAARPAAGHAAPPGFDGPPGLARPKNKQGTPAGQGAKGAPTQAPRKYGSVVAKPYSWADKAKGAVAFEPKATTCSGLNLDAYESD